MSANQRSYDDSTLKFLLERIRQLPDAGRRLLELATALANRGHHEAATHVELAALDLLDPQVAHRWRLMQARRAPANQFLLLSNDLRTTAFQKAISARVSPGDLVLEIGTGSGILAMLAAKAGAEQVVTCEHQPLMAKVARDIVRDNRLNNKVTVLTKKSTQLEIGKDLPRRAKVLLADLFTGNLLAAGGLKLIHQARKELTSSNGYVIPATASLRGRLVGGPEFERLCRINEVAGFNLERFNIFAPPVVSILPERFATLSYQTYSSIIDCFNFDFNNLSGCERRSREVELECTNSGEALGFLQWLRLNLSPDNSLESDEESSLSWTRFLHVFPRPVSTFSGRTMRIRLEHDWTSFSVWPVSHTSQSQN